MPNLAPGHRGAGQAGRGGGPQVGGAPGQGPGVFTTGGEDVDLDDLFGGLFGGRGGARAAGPSPAPTRRPRSR